MDALKDIVTFIELHDVQGISNCFKKGVHPNDTYNSQPLIYELLSEYTRSPRFKDCVGAFVDHGLQLNDKALLAVLLDDGEALKTQLQQDASIVFNTYSFRCAFTPLVKASLLHVCAEFNHLHCAQLLVQAGADINAKAGIDEWGFGAQTPIFHTVNQNLHQSEQMLDYLLSLPADLEVSVTGIIWGKGYEWETFIPAVNPLSYAMMGLLPQMHRDEVTIARVVSKLLKQKCHIDYHPANIPNQYLRK